MKYTLRGGTTKCLTKDEEQHQHNEEDYLVSVYL
jgi:hypothetical protein